MKKNKDTIISPQHFISCDWGTSNLRLRKVDFNTLDILSENQSELGIKKGYAVFKEQNVLSQEEFFTKLLLEELEKSKLDIFGNDIIVASGMISSSIGMRDMEYARMPIDFNGKELLSTISPLSNTHKLLIISGVRTDSDVMRGEETQAIGLTNYLPLKDSGILLLPGTHSKHLSFDDGHFQDLNSFMTGEIFELLANQSMLQSAMKPIDWNPSYEGVFLNGVKKGIDHHLMASLFPIRAINLIHKNRLEENYFYLSGLLIGSELSYLQNHNKTIYLAASGIMYELYRLALESFLPLERMVFFDPGLVDKAVLIGQRKILETYV